LSQKWPTEVLKYLCLTTILEYSNVATLVQSLMSALNIKLTFQACLRSSLYRIVQ